MRPPNGSLVPPNQHRPQHQDCSGSHNPPPNPPHPPPSRAPPQELLRNTPGLHCVLPDQAEPHQDSAWASLWPSPPPRPVVPLRTGPRPPSLPHRIPLKPHCAPPHLALALNPSPTMLCPPSTAPRPCCALPTVLCPPGSHLKASSMGSRLSKAVSLGSLNQDLMGMALSGGRGGGGEGLGGALGPGVPGGREAIPGWLR